MLVNNPKYERTMSFPDSTVVKSPPAVQETQVAWVGKIPLKKEMATHSSILAWEILFTEEPGRLQSMGAAKSQTGLSD